MAQGLQADFAAKALTTHPMPVPQHAQSDILVEGVDHLQKNLGFPRATQGRKPRLRTGTRAHTIQDTEEVQIMMDVKEEAFEADLLILAAHQLLSPLSLIDSTAQRLMHSAEAMSPEDVRARATRIRNATARLSALIQALMQRARVGRQRVLDRQALDWRDLIHLASDHIRCYQPNRTITVKGLEVPAPFEGDPILLEQML